MPENAQRSWTLYVCPECGKAVVADPDPKMAWNRAVHFMPSSCGGAKVESVPVVEAVLTPEAVEAGYEALRREGWAWMTTVYPDEAREAVRSVLRSANFRGSDKEGDEG